MDDSRAPALRASDAERERAADALRYAAGEGRLTMEELDERLHSAYEAQTRAQLERLVADIAVPGSPAAPAAVERRVPVRRGEGGTRWIVAVMGGSDRQGRWRLAPRATVFNLMGGNYLDLNDAELSDDRSELRVYAIMGGAEIRVPAGMNVQVSEFALMGGNSIKVGESHPDPGGPVLHVRLFSLMGGTDVRRRPGKKRRQR